jgi:hypothetical protein
VSTLTQSIHITVNIITADTTAAVIIAIAVITIMVMANIISAAAVQVKRRLM